MKLIQLFFKIICACLLLGTIGCTAKKETLTVLTENLPPLNYSYQDSAAGFASEIVQKMLTAAGIDSKIRFENWSRAYQKALKEPNTLIFSLARTRERENLFIWIGQITVEDAGVFARSNSKTGRPEKISDLAKQRFCVIKDSYFHQYLQTQGLELSDQNLASSTEELVNRLKLQETDLIIDNRNAINFTIRSLGYYLSDFEMALRIADLRKDYYIALSRNSDPALADRLKKAYLLNRNSGLNNEIISKYLDKQ